MSDVKKNYTTEELDRMSNAELAALGTELDDVTVAYRKERFPVEGDPREKSAAAGITTWLVISVLTALAFLGIYLFWPWEPKFHGDEDLWVYTLYTPLLGLTAALSFTSLGIAVIQYVKKFIPEEISVQRRHDGRSSELDRRTTTALLNDAWETSTLGRRKAMKGLLGTAGVLAGRVVDRLVLGEALGVLRVEAAFVRVQPALAVGVPRQHGAHVLARHAPHMHRAGRAAALRQDAARHRQRQGCGRTSAHLQQLPPRHAILGHQRLLKRFNTRRRAISPAEAPFVPAAPARYAPRRCSLPTFASRFSAATTITCATARTKR